MQINISHHQPLVGGAWGQDDEVRPILSVIWTAKEVKLGLHLTLAQ